MYDKPDKPLIKVVRIANPDYFALPLSLSLSNTISWEGGSAGTLCLTISNASCILSCNAPTPASAVGLPGPTFEL